MLATILIASLLIVITTAIHAVGMMVAIRLSRSFWNLHPKHPMLPIARPMVVSCVVLLMFLLSILEVLVWSVSYRLLGVFPELEPAMYFSMVTYTTLGYGDVVLNEQWRLLASFQAANGIIIFGWTTAVVLAVVQRLYGKQENAARTGGQ
ncbi:potassium channel family protein [Microbulbifer marinus]|uniref:Ion channel n=1 Tax=Microbulbifer marinus TaxID=658218 RepID=A0A1H3VPT9_9GAMM|nr:potassium channel family protein [Microbulbifer marinus]SDZ76128.1 Ion channel [Microbulbifer marinus]